MGKDVDLKHDQEFRTLTLVSLYLPEGFRYALNLVCRFRLYEENWHPINKEDNVQSDSLAAISKGELIGYMERIAVDVLNINKPDIPLPFFVGNKDCPEAF
ncbi:MAG: hypothetical protein DDT32_02359 [Syntrophomonadaceae bacterium]|nr:hypothetical protein [Bacillota bacterium]MBT9148584.1 hypothetical protein [Bacillota bacterium]